ncbi:hypothetical protein FB451DRAFT_1111353 [Mycena latifolia]|nr:hypothetical protein FB451DRAFT_1111353 [Mycena latifolia]
MPAMAASGSSPSTDLARTKQSSSLPVTHDTLLPRTNTLQIIRRGPGHAVSRFLDFGGDLFATAGDKLFNLVAGPTHYKLRIERFFGEVDCDKRLDDLYAALQATSRNSLSRDHRALWDDCHNLLKRTRPNSHSIDTQFETFHILVSLITRYPGLRRRFSDHKDLRNDPKQSEADFIDSHWKRQLQSCGEEWNFHRRLAAFCVTENTLAKLVEAAKPSELGRVEFGQGTMNKVPIETLLGWCRDAISQPGFDSSRICAIRYLGGILVLPSFWENRAPDEARFFAVLSDVCHTVFQLINDTGEEVADTSVDTPPASVDMSPETSAAREAVDILCTATLNGLLFLNKTKPLPRPWLDTLPDIPSQLSSVAMKTCFPRASAVASGIVAQRFSDNETATDRDEANDVHENSEDPSAETILDDHLNRNDQEDQTVAEGDASENTDSAGASFWVGI